MRKKYQRILQSLLFSLLLALTLISPMCVTAEAANYYMVDDAGLLSDAQAATIETQLSELSKKQGIDFVVFTENNPDISSPANAADDFFDYNGYGTGADHSGALLYINMATRDCYISTCGYAITAFTDAGLDYMIAQIAPSLSDEDYVSAFETYISLCDDFMEQAKSGEPYDRNDMPKGAFPFLRYFIISLAVGGAIGLIYVLVLRSQLKSVAPNESAADYMVPGSMHLTKSREYFLYHTIHRTQRAQNQSHGGSSTHVSSSGVSHGGRGGKF